MKKKERRKGTKVTQELINKLRELREAGFSLEAAGKKVGVAGSTASCIYRGGFTMDGYKKKMAEDNSRKIKASTSNKTTPFSSKLITPELCRAVKIAIVIDGLTAVETGKKLGLSRSTVDNIKRTNYSFEEYKKKTEEYRRRHEEKKSENVSCPELKKELEDMMVVIKKMNIRLARFKEESYKQLSKIENKIDRVATIKEKKGRLGRFGF